MTDGNERWTSTGSQSPGRDGDYVAAEVPIRPNVTTFTLEEANDALIRLAEDRIDGTGILVVDEA